MRRASSGTAAMVASKSVLGAPSSARPTTFSATGVTYSSADRAQCTSMNSLHGSMA
jgi:hypothetical protein